MITFLMVLNVLEVRSAPTGTFQYVVSLLLRDWVCVLLSLHTNTNIPPNTTRPLLNLAPGGSSLRLFSTFWPLVLINSIHLSPIQWNKASSPSPEPEPGAVFASRTSLFMCVSLTGRSEQALLDTTNAGHTEVLNRGSVVPPLEECVCVRVHVFISWTLYEMRERHHNMLKT